jgi:hypothetical protein
MDISIDYSHRFAVQIISKNPPLGKLYDEILQAVNSISEEDLLTTHIERFPKQKSLSKSLNYLIDSRLTDTAFIAEPWKRQSKIFKGAEYQRARETTWTLDFSKATEIVKSDIEDGETSMTLVPSGIAVEVAFNHGEAAAWNILKPVLAAELNHVEKETTIGEGLGVLIVVSQEMADLGGFDGAVGDFERYMKHIKVMRNQLTVPMMLIAISAPVKYFVERYPGDFPQKNKQRRSTGRIVDSLSGVVLHEPRN